ncbi:uncharacterized protein LA080_014664 [Diaporthe eres]|nr:uncharacterized protein LA080_014664 [Diaporthe eres]
MSEAFRTKNGGNALHELLQYLLEDTKSPADCPKLNQSATAASSTDISAFVSPAQSKLELDAVLNTRNVTPHGSWCDSGLGRLAGMRQHLMQPLLRHGRTAEPLPSDQSLSRYIHAFLGGFHERYPLFHTHTTPLTDLPVDLAFALLAIGADSCLENKAALYLLESAVATSPARLGQRKKDLNVVFASHDMPSAAAATPTLVGEDSWLDESSHALCIMSLLTAFALQNRSPHAMRVMWSVQGLLAHELRQSLSLCDLQEELTSEDPVAWSEWARRESRLRIKHAAFCTLNLVRLTFDFPAAVRFEQLHVAVPCSVEEWDAPSPEEWLQARKRIQPKPLLLPGIVEALLNGGAGIEAPSTVLGDFTILHAISQRIRTIRQVLPVIPEEIQTNLEYVAIAVSFCPPVGALTLVSNGLGVRNSPLDIDTDPQGFLCTVRLSIFLVKWLLVIAGIDHEHSVKEDEQQIIQSVGDAVQEATRCIELGTLRDREDLPSIAIGVLDIMIHVFRRSQREHINLVGNAFGLYVTMLRTPGEDPDVQENADHASEKFGDVYSRVIK